MNRERATVAIGGLSVLVLAAYTLLHINVVLDVSKFFLGDVDSRAVRISQQLATGPASRTLVVALGAPTTEAALAAGIQFEKGIQQDVELMDTLEAMEGAPPNGIDEAMWRLYEPRIQLYFAPSVEEARALTSDEGIARALDRLMAHIEQGEAMLISRVAPRDPWLVLPRLFTQLKANSSGLILRHGRYLSADERYAVLFLRTKASAFNGAAQSVFLEGIRRVFSKLDDASKLELKMAGLHRFSVEIERSVKADITRVSVMSVLMLLAVFGYLFRSLRLVFITLIVVFSGFVGGAAATLLLFGKIHGLTLAFGSSLIGVAIDYTIHCYVHYVLARDEESPRKLLERLWPGLLLGATTTIVGFVALGASSLPGLFEVSIFSAIGIACSLLATWLFLPACVSLKPKKETAERAARWIEHSLRKIKESPRFLSICALALAVVIGGVGFFQLRWDDNIANLTRLKSSLVEEEEEVRAKVAPFEQRRFIVALAPSLEAALDINDQVHSLLEAAQAKGELKSFRNISPWLRSKKTQMEVGGYVRSEPGLRSRFETMATAKGFSPGAFEPFFTALNAPSPEPLAYQMFAASPAGEWAQSFVIDISGPNGNEVGIISFLGGVSDPIALSKKVDILPGAFWFDQSKIYKNANEKLRVRTFWGFAVGILGVFGLVWFRYQRLRLVASALVPATCAVLTTIAVLGLLGMALNLVTLTALLMVFSMGVDYGVFISESERESDNAATLLAVVVAWASTLAGFGFLALSSHPAMRTIGVVASVGVSATLVYTPLVLTVVYKRGVDV